MQQRSTGVTVISILFFLGGIAMLLTGIGILAIPIPVIDPLLQIVANYVIAIGLSAVLLGGTQIAVGWGLWTLRNWARITAVVLFALGAIWNLVSGIGLLVGIEILEMRVAYPGAGIANLLIAALQGVVIWYLSTPDVVMSFEAGVGYPPVERTFVEPEPLTPVRPTAPPPSPRVQTTEVYGQQPRPTGWLIARDGPQAGKNFGLKAGHTTIGRDTRKADIILDTSTVSGEHARVRYEGGQFFLYDLASTNGTFINNRQIQKQMLRDGDVVRFGQAEMVFKSVS